MSQINQQELKHLQGIDKNTNKLLSIEQSIKDIASSLKDISKSLERLNELARADYIAKNNKTENTLTTYASDDDFLRELRDLCTESDKE